MLDGRLKEVTTMGKLSLERQKAGSSRLIEAEFPILFYNYFGTLITGRLVEVELCYHIERILPL